MFILGQILMEQGLQQDWQMKQTEEDLNKQREELVKDENMDIPLESLFY